MRYFADKHSIVRKIWGSADTVMFIFAGSAAEFAVNKAVDWLYFTGKLPSDPLGRLFSTVEYARLILFAEHDTALKAIDKITAIHSGVEEKRGQKIPAYAYRDVLFMLIDYSIRSYELLERPLTFTEKEEVFCVFDKVGRRMNIPDLPENYNAWLIMRQGHLDENLVKSNLTVHLYQQYRKHLGLGRYLLLTQVQVALAPLRVKQLLNLTNLYFLKPVIYLYKLFRKIKVHWILKEAILPQNYKAQIKALDAPV